MSETSPDKIPENDTPFLKRIGHYIVSNSPGMRVIKTSIAIMTCLLIEFTRGNPSLVTSSFAAVVCMQPTIKGTVKTATDRVFGTLIAGVFAYAAITLLAHVDLTPDQAIYFVVVALLTIVLMTFLVLIKKPTSLAISVIVFLIIATSHTDDAFVYAYSRVLDTLTGIVVALFVNWFPPLNKLGRKHGQVEFTSPVDSTAKVEKHIQANP